MTTTIDERLLQLTKESAALDTSRVQAQQEVDAYAARMEVVAQRFSAIQVATTALKGLAPLAPATEWRDHLVEWRKTLCDELLAIKSPIRDSRTMGVQQNLKLSILTI